MRGSRASNLFVGALLLISCGCSGSGSGTPGSGGGGAGASAGNGGAGGLGASGGGGTAGPGAAGGSGAAGTGTAGSGAAGNGAAGSGVAGSGAAGSGAAGNGAAGNGAGGSATGGAGGGASCLSLLSHDIDVPASSINVQISVQGVSSSTGNGTLDLRTAAGDRALLGTTMLGNPAAPVVVLPGTYDVYYRNDKAGPGLPVNQLAKIMTGVAVPPPGNPTMLNVVVPATPVTVALTLPGITVSNVTGTSIHLRTAGGDDATLGTTATPVVPGTYDVYYVPAYAVIGPINQSAKLQSGFVVGASPTTLNVAVPGATVSGTFTMGGSMVHTGTDAV